ncbi:sensor histidine kinase [Rhodobacterales bacterium HKCCE2091]|nr:sensor histidine kinase [Rhodobacterales bacterium HKCCE2091]
MAALLAIAVIPVGLIAVYQTARNARAFEEQRNDTLVALTRQAALREETAIQRASGAAEALGSMLVSGASETSETCSELMRIYVDSQSQASFAGFIPPDGMVTCSSAGRDLDLHDRNFVAEMNRDHSTMIWANPNGEVSRTSVLIVSEPIFAETEWIGNVIISIPHSRLRINEQVTGSLVPIEVITFNPDGAPLTAERGLDELGPLLPRDRPLVELATLPAQSFEATALNGETLVYAITPIVDRAAVAMSIWPEEAGEVQTSAVPTTLFPFLMWAISIAVAVFALDRLVMRPMRQLHGRMDEFARHRRLRAVSAGEIRSAEMRQLSMGFEDMADAIIHDEAELENSLHEKSVLLKEVHHRVKNNLQMISSIMNMQIRRAQTEEAQTILRRLQDRVLGLAAIHRNLQDVEAQGRINVGKLLDELAVHTLASSTHASEKVSITRDLDSVVLYPDQAMPLSLLFSEALGNALKYVAPDPETGRREIAVSLSRDESDKVTLEVSNSVSDLGQADGDTGLGSQLIRAFLHQLGGQLTVGEDGGRYTLRVEFQREDFEPQPQKDY